MAVFLLREASRVVRSIGMADLKIAAMARVHDALLLSGNQRDFGRVPGLRVESWIVCITAAFMMGPTKLSTIRTEVPEPA